MDEIGLQPDWHSSPGGLLDAGVERNWRFSVRSGGQSQPFSVLTSTRPSESRANARIPRRIRQSEIDVTMHWGKGTIIAALPHFLDERGRIAVPTGPALKLAEHLVAIVTMTTSSLQNPADGAPGSIRCRARPAHRPCPGYIDSDIVPLEHGDDDEIIWWCKSCTSHGAIREWEGTFWDMSDSPAKLAELHARGRRPLPD